MASPRAKAALFAVDPNYALILDPKKYENDLFWRIVRASAKKDELKHLQQAIVAAGIPQNTDDPSPYHNALIKQINFLCGNNARDILDYIEDCQIQAPAEIAKHVKSSKARVKPSLESATNAESSSGEGGADEHSNSASEYSAEEESSTTSVMQADIQSKSSMSKEEESSNEDSKEESSNEDSKEESSNEDSNEEDSEESNDTAEEIKKEDETAALLIKYDNTLVGVLTKACDIYLIHFQKLGADIHSVQPTDLDNKAIVVSELRQILQGEANADKKLTNFFNKFDGQRDLLKKDRSSATRRFFKAVFNAMTFHLLTKKLKPDGVYWCNKVDMLFNRRTDLKKRETRFGMPVSFR